MELLEYHTLLSRSCYVIDNCICSVLCYWSGAVLLIGGTMKLIDKVLWGSFVIEAVVVFAIFEWIATLF
jgi:hypothetical protein